VIVDPDYSNLLAAQSCPVNASYIDGLGLQLNPWLVGTGDDVSTTKGDGGA
jgi:hypothetical protein